MFKDKELENLNQWKRPTVKTINPASVDPFRKRAIAKLNGLVKDIEHNASLGEIYTLISTLEEREELLTLGNAPREALLEAMAVILGLAPGVEHRITFDTVPEEEHEAATENLQCLSQSLTEGTSARTERRKQPSEVK